MSLDVLCMGRAGVDLYAEQVGLALEEVTSFAKYMGGCAGNIAVGASRLGLRAGMLTRVGDDGLGRFVKGYLASEGVDVSRVALDPKHLTGLAVLGIQPPDRFPLIFYRVECADIHLTPEEVEDARIEEASALVVTGTGLSHEPSRAATLLAVQRAQRAGARVVLDVDARPMLWDGGEEQMREQLRELVPRADLVVGTEEEMALAAETSVELAAQALRRSTRALLVLKRGARGASAYPLEGAPVHAPGFRVTVLNTLGAGDGFMAGFLRAWLKRAPLLEALELGNAVGAIVVTRHGCAPAMPRFEEAQALIASGRAPPSV